MDKNAPTTVTSFRASWDLVAMLKQEAQAAGMTRNDFIVTAVREKLAARRDESKQAEERKA